MSEIVRTESLNGYEYTVYDTGTIVATGQLQDETAARNSYNQRIAGGESRQPTDQGGHIVAASHNGSSDRINITAQDAKVNTRDIRAVERDETSALRSGDTITTERIAHCYSDPNRPDAYMINDTVVGSDGITRTASSSFTNTDMSQYDDDLDQDVSPSDDSFTAVEETGISRDELYKALEDDNIPNDYDHSWTGHETSENQMEDFGSNSSCSTTSSSEGTGGNNEDNSNSSTMTI